MTDVPQVPDPPCSRCGAPAPVACLACTRPVCMTCALPAPSSATTLHDPTDANVYFCSFDCQEIYLDIHRQ